MGSLALDSFTLSRASIEAAHEKIRTFVHETPVLTSQSINTIVSKAIFPATSQDIPDNDAIQQVPRVELFFKCENFQKIGAFKARGAFFNVMSLSESAAEKGVCTHSSAYRIILRTSPLRMDDLYSKKGEGYARLIRPLSSSTGNHAQALALAAKTRGIPAYIVMPTISEPLKIAATKGYNAAVTFSGSTAPERQAALEEIRQRTGATFIPPYDYLGTILGQGTVGLELEQQARQILSSNGSSSLSDLDAVITPLGGGGLLGGTAIALSGQTWNAHPAFIYGAEPSHEGADDGKRGLATDPPTRIEDVKSLTIADGLRTPVGKLNWEIISDKSKVAGVYSVTDRQIKNALKIILERLKIFVEPSAAVGLAVVLYDPDFQEQVRQKAREYERDVWRIGIVLSGGNVSLKVLAEHFNNDC